MAAAIVLKLGAALAVAERGYTPLLSRPVRGFRLRVSPFPRRCGTTGNDELNAATAIGGGNIVIYEVRPET